jgi:hypothetical protein
MAVNASAVMDSAVPVALFRPIVTLAPTAVDMAQPATKMQQTAVHVTVEAGSRVPIVQYHHLVTLWRIALGMEQQVMLMPPMVVFASAA